MHCLLTARRPIRIAAVAAGPAALAMFWPRALLAQAQDVPAGAGEGALLVAPAYWFLLTAALALLVPAGFLLIGVAGLPPQRAWNAALGGLAAIGLASAAFWAIGFGLQFGGVGLVYPQAGLDRLVWEWSPLSTQWGSGWGVAGRPAGSCPARMTSLTYALFMRISLGSACRLAAGTALRRAPATATMILALIIGGHLPWRATARAAAGWALGNNLTLGHGVDFGGAGTVHLVASGVALAALAVWIPRRPRQPIEAEKLPPVQLPLLAVTGSLMIMAGSVGWLWSNPLQMSSVGDLALMRGSVNMMLFASAGVIVPLLYTWFVTGKSDPVMSARGLAAGVVAGLAAGPFIQPGVAFITGLLAGASVPFVTFLVNGWLRLDDATGIVSVSGLPAVFGLLVVGVFSDGAAGQGWNMTGLDDYLGVAGQGVTGLFTVAGYQADFPGQLQAVIGI